MRTCKQPDRDVPALVCGYPIPCPHHTIVIEDGTVTVPPAALARGVEAALDVAAVLAEPIAGREIGKSDRRTDTDRRANKRRTGDKLKARLASGKRKGR